MIPPRGVRAYEDLHPRAHLTALSVDLLHFVRTKKGYIFKMGQPVGPFVISTRHALKIVEALIEAMEFEKGQIWHYDPQGILA